MSIEEELLTELSYFGLDKTDSTMYLGLLRIGSLTVGKMSTKLDIDRVGLVKAKVREFCE